MGGVLGSHSFLCSRYRGEGIVHATPEKVWACVKPLAGTLRDKWDENVSSFEIIESLTDVSLPKSYYPSSNLTLSLWRGSGAPFGKVRTPHSPGAWQTQAARCWPRSGPTLARVQVGNRVTRWAEKS